MAEDSDPDGIVELFGALERLAQVERLLVALDFDGVLAPFVDDPGAARALPRSKAAIERLVALERTTLAFVSGRPVASLELVAEPPAGAVLVGSHGVELRLGDGSHELVLEPAEVQRLERLDAALHALAESYPGTFLERKPVGLGVHTRQLSEADAAAVQQRAIALATGPGPALTVRGGKDVVEFAVRDATKGDGIRRLAEHVGASAVFFAGDDVTDEDGFAVLRARDVGVKVGPGVTVAGYRVADPDEVSAVLEALADARAAATGG